MIEIDNFCGRFGNRVILYNNVRQLAWMTGQQWYCPSWLQLNNGNEITEDPTSSFDVPLAPYRHPTTLPLNAHELMAMTDDEIKAVSSKHNIILKQPYLGRLFFRFTKEDPNRYFKHSERVIEDSRKMIGVHIRGSDFHSWKPGAALGVEYYLEGIRTCLEDVDDEYHVMLCTDDHEAAALGIIKNELRSMGVRYESGPDFGRSTFLADFLELTSCEYLVSSPSTMSISAGFLGKRKKVVHSKKWVEDRASVDDSFWVNLNAGGNEFYNSWRLI